MSKTPEWEPITIVESENDPPKDGGVRLRRRLSTVPDALWSKAFQGVGTHREGSFAFIDLTTDPVLSGDTIIWAVPQRDAEGGSKAIEGAVAAANDRYADQLR